MTMVVVIKVATTSVDRCLAQGSVPKQRKVGLRLHGTTSRPTSNTSKTSEPHDISGQEVWTMSVPHMRMAGVGFITELDQSHCMRSDGVNPVELERKYFRPD